MEKAVKRVPAGYFEGNPKKPFHIIYTAVNRKTGEETPMHPKDLPYEKRLEITDRLACGLGYKRIISNKEGVVHG